MSCDNKYVMNKSAKITFWSAVSISILVLLATVGWAFNIGATVSANSNQIVTNKERIEKLETIHQLLIDMNEKLDEIQKEQ